MASVDLHSLYQTLRNHLRTAFQLHATGLKINYNRPITYTLKGTQLNGNNLSLTYALGKSYFKRDRIYHIIDLENTACINTAEYTQRSFCFAAYDDVDKSWLLGIRYIVSPAGKPEEVYMRVFGGFGHDNYGFYMTQAPWMLDKVDTYKPADVDYTNNIRNRHNKFKN